MSKHLRENENDFRRAAEIIAKIHQQKQIASQNALKASQFHHN